MSILSDVSGREFIYWPLPIKALVWLAVFLVILVAGWFFFWSGTVENYNRLVDTEAQLKRTLEDKIKASRGKKELQDQIPTINAQFGELLKLLPTSASVDNLIFDLNQVGASKGIVVKSITGQGEQASAYFVKVPVTIGFQSNFSELGRFVEDLSRLPRIVTVENFNLKRLSTDPANPRLEVTATANTYRNIEPVVAKK